MPFKFMSLILVMVGLVLCFGVHKLSNNLVSPNYSSYTLILFFYKGWFIDYVYGYVGKKLLSYGFDFFIFDKKNIELLGPLALSQFVSTGATWAQQLTERPVLEKQETAPSVIRRSVHIWTSARSAAASNQLNRHLGGTVVTLQTLRARVSTYIQVSGRIHRYYAHTKHISARPCRLFSLQKNRWNQNSTQSREYFKYLVCSYVILLILLFGTSL
jgi:hypothetical protein